MSTVLFTEVKLGQIAEPSSRRGIRTGPALSHGQLVTGVLAVILQISLRILQAQAQMKRRAKC